MGVQYSWSLFKAISHMLCIGFGRFPPQNTTEVWLTIISMMIGATFYALFIGNMSTLLLSIDSSGRIYNEKVGIIQYSVIWTCTYRVYSHIDFGIRIIIVMVKLSLSAIYNSFFS